MPRTDDRILLLTTQIAAAYVGANAQGMGATTVDATAVPELVRTTPAVTDRPGGSAAAVRTGNIGFGRPSADRAAGGRDPEFRLR